MQRLLGLAFAFLLACEIGLLVVVGSGVAMLPYLLWKRSPVRAGLCVVFLVGVIIWLWKSRHSEATLEPPTPATHPGISISRIPITGVPGTLYMLQFVVWVLVVPKVGLFFAALIGAALLLLPLGFYLHRPGRGSAASVSIASILGVLSGLAVAALVSAREFPAAGVFIVALVLGVLGAPALIWSRSRQEHTSIAPYRSPGQ